MFGMLKRKLEGGTILDEHQLIEVLDDIRTTVKLDEVFNVFDDGIESVWRSIASTGDCIINERFS
jgi:hypothetical protein